MTPFEQSHRWHGAAFRIGYTDAQANKPMRRNWHGNTKTTYRYGMGYFHGRAHRYGGPIVMVTPSGAQSFVSDPGRFSAR